MPYTYAPSVNDTVQFPDGTSHLVTDEHVHVVRTTRESNQVEYEVQRSNDQSDWIIVSRHDFKAHAADALPSALSPEFPDGRVIEIYTTVTRRTVVSAIYAGSTDAEIVDAVTKRGHKL